jgi:hypothetical protein
MNITLTYASENQKTGPIPVSISSRETCPTACPLAKAGCYAEYGPMLWAWNRVTRGEIGDTYAGFLRRVQELPRGQLWRHNTAGDLMSCDNYRIDQEALKALVAANAGKRGFTYTHYPMEVKENREAVAYANQHGFTINLSANNLDHADWLADLAIGPVAVALPVDTPKVQFTAQGRKVLQCPATWREGMTCAKCGICASSRPERAIIGFPAHGTAKRKAERITLHYQKGDAGWR